MSWIGKLDQRSEIPGLLRSKNNDTLVRATFHIWNLSSLKRPNTGYSIIWPHMDHGIHPIVPIFDVCMRDSGDTRVFLSFSSLPPSLSSKLDFLMGSTEEGANNMFERSEGRELRGGLYSRERPLRTAQTAAAKGSRDGQVEVPLLSLYRL